MALLHIYDASYFLIVQTAQARNAGHQLPVKDMADFLGALIGLTKGTENFDQILFETHGSPGHIAFNGEGLGAKGLRQMKGFGFHRFVKENSRIYFNGCNVAEGKDGWDFLQAAAEVFLNGKSGQVFGQTSVGIGNPFNGHVVHLWGSTRVLYIDSGGRVIERFEQPEGISRF